jgi:chemotaxis protein CheD
MAIDLKIADLVITDSDDTIHIYGLGSCVAVILRDPVAGITGACHIMLPASPNGTPTTKPAKYADAAIRTMVKEMKDRGARKRNMTAKIVGGARMFSFHSPKETLEPVGRRNERSVRKLLERLAIPLISHDTGGNHGRTVEIESATGSVRIKTIHRGEKII